MKIFTVKLQKTTKFQVQANDVENAELIAINLVNREEFGNWEILDIEELD